MQRSTFRYQVAFLLRHKNDLEDHLRDHGVDVVCLDGGRGLGWVKRLRKLVRAEPVDLVHTHSPYSASIARLALRHLGIPFVHTEHNVWSRHRVFTHWLNLLTFPTNDHVFAVSNEVKGSIRYPATFRRHRMPPLETLYQGLDSASYKAPSNQSSARDALGISQADAVVGTTAHFLPQKGHHELLEAARLVVDENPEVRFVLIGRGPLEDDLKRKAETLGVASNVTFAGYRADAAQLAAAFDIFVLPSRWEGLPIALLEAMASGVPAIATDVGGIQEVISNGDDGIIVEPRSPRALARAIVGLLPDEDLRKRLGEQGRRRAERFDIRTTLARTEQVYRELLGGEENNESA